MKKRIIAIGGGENGRQGYPYETAEIDQEIVRLCEKENPKLLFIGTASNDDSNYFHSMSKVFKKLGCIVNNLSLTINNYTEDDIYKIITQSDIVYVGGGNPKRLLELWNEKKIVKILDDASENGLILSGLSAGSLCWFSYCNSDSLKFNNENIESIKQDGLGFIDAVNCPHYDNKDNRKNELKAMMKHLPDKVAIALDNCSAIEIIGDKYRIITSKTTANAYRTYWLNNVYYEEIIPKTLEYSNLTDLIVHPKNRK
ncbi:Type 1 glutamine amidotransferase-like domain-containing protein [Breznakia pachnodae]|uniref:Dipeptidase E n=1 Tax=Breznakia pachnodae TaxID=265178 RepID=A0ABU0E640_9FIRM|nr:Type 1 glutamine amidotransferase-like domain-containing protein [Breznakia pachnodae]MDQ0362371.1 dipeptidase E [Breznakia pachnodae]